MRPAYRKNDRDSRARQRTDSCERCGKPHATDACPSFTNNREVPLDDVARAALAGEASGGLPDIDASIVNISGEGLHCLYRCIVVALALIMVVTNIADLRVTLANYIELNPNSIVDPGSPETFAERIYREHKMTVPAYCTMMRCMISGQTHMGSAIEVSVAVKLNPSLRIITYIPTAKAATFHAIQGYGSLAVAVITAYILTKWSAPLQNGQNGPELTNDKMVSTLTKRAAVKFWAETPRVPARAHGTKASGEVRKVNNAARKSVARAAEAVATKSSNVAIAATGIALGNRPVFKRTGLEALPAPEAITVALVGQTVAMALLDPDGGFSDDA